MQFRILVMRDKKIVDFANEKRIDATTFDAYYVKRINLSRRP